MRVALSALTTSSTTIMSLGVFLWTGAVISGTAGGTRRLVVWTCAVVTGDTGREAWGEQVADAAAAVTGGGAGGPNSKFRSEAATA